MVVCLVVRPLPPLKRGLTVCISCTGMTRMGFFLILTYVVPLVPVHMQEYDRRVDGMYSLLGGGCFFFFFFWNSQTRPTVEEWPSADGLELHYMGIASVSWSGCLSGMWRWCFFFVVYGSYPGFWGILVFDEAGLRFRNTFLRRNRTSWTCIRKIWRRRIHIWEY